MTKTTTSPRGAQPARTGPETVDLTNCDREPIHVPGSIQPLGFLLAVGADWTILRAANTAQYLGTGARELPGRKLSEVFMPYALRAVRDRIAMLRGEDAVERLFSIRLIAGQDPFDVAVHSSGNAIVIECEPARGDEVEVSSMIRGVIARLGEADTQAAILREGARQLRMLTGFDRVMVYRFAPNDSGEVVAEALADGMDSFLGLHFPASDIPKQARQLYVRNIFRIIANVDDTPVPIEPVEDEPLDLSLSLFRAVSPIHIEYLRNMGVGASLSVSIVIDGKLWGLFACHHRTPRLPSFAERSAAELFGQMFSLLLGDRLRKESSVYEDRARKISDKLLAAAARDTSRLSDPQWIGDLVMDSIPSDGVGVTIEGTVALSGLAPDAEDFGEIVRALNRREDNGLYATTRIGGLIEGAERYANRAAGMLAIPISRKPRNYVVLFRSEQLRSVRWAGDQAKQVEHGPNGPRLTPRKSFEEWSDLVRGQAPGFEDSELRVANALRATLLEVVLRLTENAHEDRRRASEQQKLLIAELNHRVRNILALIRALMGQTGRETDDIGQFVSTLDSRVQSLARAHDQLTSDHWGPAPLRGLIETEASAYLSDRSQRLICTGPELTIEPTAFTVLALVVHELTTNAAKYGALSDSGTVRVEWRIDEDGMLAIDWAESGGPAVRAPTRRGFGTTVIRDSIPHELGGEANVEYLAAGFRARFRLPGQYVADILADRETGDKARPKPAHDPGLLIGKRILLVEDSALIALDAEDKLRELGATDVVLAASNTAALKAIDGGGIDAAMLDFNLGRETSTPIAERLAELGIPFVFASGYGGDDTIPEAFAAVPTILKPYAGKQIAEAFAVRLDPSFEAG